MKIRSGWHVVLGLILPWLPLGANLGGLFLFGLYQGLQYKFRSRRDLRDDSFLDVKETMIPYVISALIRSMIWVV